jgi:hypothetical protein
VGEISAMMGKTFMPHQQYMADVALEIDPTTGLLAYDEVVIIGPRQVTGKTEFLLPYLVHRCTATWPEGPQTVVWTAQTADKARERWRDIHLTRILRSPLRQQLAKPRHPYGGARLRLNQEVMWWRNGSGWSPESTTGKTSGTGDTLDVAVIDEAWCKEDARTQLGLRPAMMTRDWSQFIIASMIPGISRKAPGTWSYLQHKRQVGRARVDAGMRNGVAFFDFTAPGDPSTTDPGDPATWWLCMPGLGRTVTEAKVRQDYEKFDLIDFCAEYLGWEPGVAAPRWMLIRETTWEGLHKPDSTIDSRLALALEVSEDRMHGVICAAGRRADGHYHVEVVEPGSPDGGIPEGTMGVEWMVRRAKDMWKSERPCTVVIDPRRPASSMIVPLRNAGVDVLTPNTLDVAGACGRFYDATGDKMREDDDGVRVYHLNQRELNQSLGGARKLDQGSGGAFTFAKRGSGAELIQLYGVVLAMHGSDVKGTDDYDVTRSIDGGRPCSRCGRSVYRHYDESRAAEVWLHAVDDTPECGT